MNASKLKTWEVDVLVAWFLYRMGPRDRFRLMRDLPGIYNQLCDSPVVRVSRVADGSDVEILLAAEKGE